MFENTEFNSCAVHIYVQPYSYILNDMLYEQPPESCANILPYGHDLNVFQTTFLDGTASDLGIQF